MINQCLQRHCLLKEASSSLMNKLEWKLIATNLPHFTDHRVIATHSRGGCWLLSLNNNLFRQGQTLASNARPLPGVGSTSPPPSGQLSFQASDFGAIRFHTILVRVGVLGADCSGPVRTSLRWIPSILTPQTLKSVTEKLACILLDPCSHLTAFLHVSH